MPVIKAPAVPEKPRFGGDHATWPQDLAGFQTWWMTETSLDHGSSAQRIAPRGRYGADLLILVEQPEVMDNESLLSGPQGKMLSAMLAAMGVSEENTYFASLLTRHTPMPDWQGLQQTGLGDVLRHHLALAAPKRIIAFGGAIPSLLGHAPSQSLLTSVKIGDNDHAIPLFSALSLDALQRAKAKEGLWRRWLEWSGTIAA
jgi:DNA polymerase